MVTNKPKTRIITGCKDCPFWRRNRVYEWQDCGLDKDLLVFRDLETYKTITPIACPIKTQPIIITYES